MVQVSIVATKKNEELENLLSGLIAEKDKNIKAVSMTEEEYRNRRGQITSANKIILLENSKSLKTNQNITEYKLNDQFGFRYGWRGNVAVIDVDESRVSLKDSQEIVKRIHELTGIKSEEMDESHDDTTQAKEDFTNEEKETKIVDEEAGMSEKQSIPEHSKKTHGFFNKVKDTVKKIDVTIDDQVDKRVNPKVKNITKLGVKTVAAVGLITSVGTGSLTVYIAGMGLLGYKNKKALIRDMDIALIKSFVSDENTGLAAFLKDQEMRV